MRTQLGWRNLLHRKIRTLVSILGVSFPVVPIFFQLGLYDAMMKSAILFYDELAFDLVIVSRDYSFFSKPGSFPRTRLYQALADPSVESASPLYLAFGQWRNPESRWFREILLLAVDPGQPPFRRPELNSAAIKLKAPDTVLFDRLSRPEFGSVQTGQFTEIEGRRVQVKELYAIGTGFAALGGAMTADQTLERIFGGPLLNRPNIGLLSLTEGSASASATARLRSVLEQDVRVLSRQEIEENEKGYWARTTSIGVVLAFGLAVVFMVGTIILYQILFSDITDRLPEFATLRAIGYTAGYIRWIVLQQAAILTIGGFVPGCFMSLLVYRMTIAWTNLPMAMTEARIVTVFLFTLAIGCAAALLAIRKAQEADPADLFK